MRATGIVRRIDDLGRVVIPKEIRRTLRIKEGDPLEIYTDQNGEIIFKKYSRLGENTEFIGQVANNLHKVSGCTVLIVDTDQVVAAAGCKQKNILKRHLSTELVNLLLDREVLEAKTAERSIEIIENDLFGEKLPLLIYPVINEGDVAGAVILLANKPTLHLKEREVYLAKFAVELWNEYMEI